MWAWAFRSGQKSVFILARRTAINASHAGFLAPHVCISAYPTCVLTRLTSCNHANSSLPLAKHSTSSESPTRVKEGEETKEIVVEMEGKGTVVFEEAQKQPYSDMPQAQSLVGKSGRI